MTTSKYIGNCSACNLLLCEADMKEAGNAPICPRCSNHSEAVPFVSADREVGFTKI
jgi:hypothetical protein